MIGSSVKDVGACASLYDADTESGVKQGSYRSVIALLAALGVALSVVGVVTTPAWAISGNCSAARETQVQTPVRQPCVRHLR